jgi:hypothetical protein
LSLVCALTLQPTLLDDFSGPKAGWTDTLNSGTVTRSGGLSTVAHRHKERGVDLRQKTSAAFSNASGHRMEFRVDLKAVKPANGGTDALVILARVPAGDAVLRGGYSISVGTDDVKIQKGASVLFATNYIAVGSNIQNTNITLVLSMTP